jgi:hypothetical protein
VEEGSRYRPISTKKGHDIKAYVLVTSNQMLYSISEQREGGVVCSPEITKYNINEKKEKRYASGN